MPVTSESKVVVTGASGFIGGHLARALTERGHRVQALSRKTGFDVTKDALDLDGVACFYHVAGLTGVPRAWQEPAEFYRVNAYGTLRMLELCRAKACRFLHVSGYIYGRPERLPISEDAPIDSNNPYAFSKHAAELACRFYADHCQLDVTVVRPFNVYGPGQDNRFLISRIVEQVLDPACEHIELLDLSPRRDYVHIDDLVSAIIALSEGGHAGTFNVGSGESFSVAQVAAMILRLAGSTKRVISKEAPRSHEIDDVRADITRIRRATAWQPSVTLEAGLKRLIEHRRGE
jgi:nucleoside-diphosphate-sugar epimerase